jgi:hypothetical protein
MIWQRTAAMMMTILIPVSGYAANPFLDTQADKRVSAKFRGTEWGDDIGEQEIPLTASGGNAYSKNAAGRDFQN